jgi:rubredoxin
MSFNLSPLVRDGLALHAHPSVYAAESSGGKEKKRNTPVEVSAYRCPVCNYLHEDEDEAADCCDYEPPTGAKPHDDEDIYCPVCGQAYVDHRHAVDCCLWKDIDAPTRWRIADAVEAGAEWVEAIKAEGART